MERSRRRLPSGVVVVLVVAALVGGASLLGVSAVDGWLRDKIGGALGHPQDPVHDSAVADAAEKVDAVLARFDLDHLHQADKYAHSAGQHPDVSVLDVTGETHWQTGVTLVLQVAGHGVEIGADGSVIKERDEQVCFRLRLGPEGDGRDDDIACPKQKTPVPVAKDPSLAGVDDRLRSALRSAARDEAAVRAAVAGLRLDPAIRQEVAAREGTVGVALRASQYDCLIARVTAKAVQLWRPARIQLAPGELSCGAALAFGSTFGTNPH